MCKNEGGRIMDNSKKSFLGELIKGIIVAIITCLLTGFITNQFTKNDIVKAITTVTFSTESALVPFILGFLTLVFCG